MLLTIQCYDRPVATPGEVPSTNEEDVLVVSDNSDEENASVSDESDEENMSDSHEVDKDNTSEQLSLSLSDSD